MTGEYVHKISSRYLQKWLRYDIKHVKKTCQKQALFTKDAEPEPEPERGRRSRHILAGAGDGAAAAETVCSEPEPEP